MSEQELMARLIRLEREVARLGALIEELDWTFLTTPLTSTSWDGDAFSTTASTLLDLSAVFGVPAKARAVLLGVYVRDSGSAANDCYIALRPASTGNGLTVACSGLANDQYSREFVMMPCNDDGDIYYEIAASGAGTLDAIIRIWGYCL